MVTGPSSPEAQAAMPKDPERDRVIIFGPFRLFVREQRLEESDRPVRLGSRALDILIALLAHPGELVSKRDLMRIVWPDTVVVEANLSVHVAALRRALGDGDAGSRYIVNIPGRGYRFIAPVTLDDALPFSEPSRAESIRPHNLPAQLTRLVGRDEIVDGLVRRLATQRLLTIVGPGGVGKTAVALAVAERLIGAYEDGVWLIDLAPSADPRLVPTALASTLRLEIRSDDPLPALVAALKDKRMLLVLDNCEHVIDAAAALAASILKGSRAVQIVTTSREPLRVEGERLHRLHGLASPPASERLSAADTLRFSAARLFVERVTAAMDEFELRDADAPSVRDICRNLDGIPLAIEFAAARAAVFGVQGVAACVGDLLRLLTGGRRSAPRRHQTITAVLDWSYQLLSSEEQTLLRRLAVFVGGFTLESAAAIAASADETIAHVTDRIAGLVPKSLVTVDEVGGRVRFRLLEITRAYAIEKLDESGERGRIARRHAEYYRMLFKRAEDEVAARPAGEWLAGYIPEIDNLRAALDWAFSPDGDGSVGVALTAAAVPLWLRLSLLEECRIRAKQAFGALGTAGTRDPREEMRLHAALGASTAEATEVGAAFTKALDIAETLGDYEYQLRALRGLYFYHAGNGRHGAALQSAQKFHDLAMSGADWSDRLYGERMMGAAKHFLGDQISARRHIEQVLTYYAATDHGRDVIRSQDAIRFGTDLRVSARAFLARVLWLQGFPHQAARTVEMSIEEAQATGHALSLCYALAYGACPVAMWVGNLAAAGHYTEMLLDHSRRHSLSPLTAFGSALQTIVVIKRGDLDAGLRLLPGGLDEIVEPNFKFRFLPGLSELAEALANTGQIAETLAVLEAGIEQSEAGWLTPELLCLKGELLLLQGTPAPAETAKDLFRQALDEAHRQEALSWELRAATSLARLLRNQGRPADAIACLQPVYDRFTEGFDTADLIAAKQLLDELGGVGRRDRR